MAAAASGKDGGRGAGLARDAIVAEALRLLDESGFAGLTLRRLAARLQVKAAALYWHFADKQDLIDAIAERIMLDEFQRLRPAQPFNTIPWRELLTTVARTNRGALMRYRDGAQIMAHANMGQGNMLDGMEALLGALSAQGFSLPLAMGSIFTIIRYTLGYVFEEQADPHAGSRHAQRVARIKKLAARYPNIAQMFVDFHANGTSHETMFEQGLATILDGVAHQLAASGKKAA
ncbi:MAG TPA: TetR/AcrR family transcriptional regulator C-terminal domain-containing protein [Candidatus Saccharimonadales bacterium]|nr:TetR/AcrR family transcriptional regulator C-terminal domain-containing protein [Candidatus Saccharimonadales bacterium]